MTTFIFLEINEVEVEMDVDRFRKKAFQSGWSR